jgi:Ni/Fe-hydrogenase subunit HybB-like protein
MATDTRAQHGAAGYAAGPVTKAPAWHGLVACDLLFNNLATGLFLTEALGELAAPEVFRPLAKVAYPLALLFLVVDLLCLVLDLGDPLRFHHMLRVFKPTSPMSLGTWCLAVYSLPLTAAAALSLLPGGWPALEWVRKAAVILGLLPALGSAAYKGVLLSTNAQPGWRDARWMGGYLTSSALMLGCAGLLGLSVLMGQERASVVLRPALVLTLVLNALVLSLLLAELRGSLRHIFAPPQLGHLGLLALGGGMLAPLCLLLAGDGAAVLLAVVLLLVLGSLAIRFVIVKIPHALMDQPRGNGLAVDGNRPAMQRA